MLCELIREYGNESDYWLKKKTYAEWLLMLDYRKIALENFYSEKAKDKTVNKKKVSNFADLFS